MEKKHEKGEDGRNSNRFITISVFSTVQVADMITQISPILKWDALHSLPNFLVNWLESKSGQRLRKAKSRRKVSSGEAYASEKRHKISGLMFHKEEKSTTSTVWWARCTLTLPISSSDPTLLLSL